ncbi:iron-containing redox enzyme family protein [Kitasatospora sp. NBC_01539]|uniref:iron-containing redox enzyme family protein n=1 Tax=Kitasatospora sp. NBC_01539 TaxID=2903577 RepID=UPI0038601C54
MPVLPSPRGDLSSGLLAALTAGPPGPASPPLPVPDPGTDPWDEDLHLALYVCYELHYRGFAGVDPGWEWAPSLLSLRGALERRFLDGLHAETPVRPLGALLEDLLTEPRTGSGPSHRLLAAGSRQQAREYLVHRSLYHLKEADPQLWVVPRLTGAPRAAVMTVQFDEYGAGHPERAHARLFGEMMADFGLDPAYGHYVDAAAGPAFAVVNLMSMFGLHRALRGALVGQFAAVEIGSPPGAARLAAAFERLGAGPAGTLFYREHVEADAVHEQVVRHQVIAPMVEAEPELEADIAFGIAASTLTETRFARLLTEAWDAGASSLRGGALAAGR